MEEELTTQIITQITTAIVPILIASIGVISTWLLNQLRKWAKTKTDSQSVDMAFNVFEQITKGAVVRAEQVIKEYSADGKITASEALKIKKIVFNDIKGQIPTSAETILKKTVNNFDDFIDTKIEETVFFIKQDKLKKECL
jgi:hypothetical protein